MSKETIVSTSKMPRSEENACVNGVWQLGLISLCENGNICPSLNSSQKIDHCELTDIFLCFKVFKTIIQN